MRISNSGMNREEYYKMCVALGVDPKEDEIPPDIMDFLNDTLIVFDIYNLLPDDWDTFNGNYLGKKLDVLPMLFDIFNVSKDRQPIYLLFINTIMEENIKSFADKIQHKQEIDKKLKDIADKGAKNG